MNAGPAPVGWLAIAVGGAVGTGLRLLADATVPAPWALVLVNALGSIALLGLLLGVWPRQPNAPAWLREGLGTGVLGAFTTLSAVSLAIVTPAAVPAAATAGPGMLAAAVGAGAVGTLLRAGAMAATARLRLPVGVLLANVLGSCIAGLALAGLLRGTLEPGLVVVLIAGACGGLTTFSTVIADTVRAWLSGRRWLAVAVLVANFALGAGAAWIGLHA